MTYISIQAITFSKHLLTFFYLAPPLLGGGFPLQMSSTVPDPLLLAIKKKIVALGHTRNVSLDRQVFRFNGHIHCCSSKIQI